MVQRNQTNPFYQKYIEMGKKMDATTDPVEKEKYYQENNKALETLLIYQLINFH